MCVDHAERRRFDRSRSTSLTLSIAAALCFCLAGCEDTSAPPAKPNDSSGGSSTKSTSSVDSHAPQPTAPTTLHGSVPTSPLPPSDATPADTEYQEEVAQAGVGKQGQNYGGGVVSEPIRQYFRTGQQIIFLKMQNAMNNYKTLNGGLPKSHDEFMQEIIQASQITLPELPAGQEYAYDPDKGELMVRRPK